MPSLRCPRAVVCAVLLACGAEARPSGDAAAPRAAAVALDTPTASRLRPADVVGCYRIGQRDGAPLDVDSALWAVPIRLDTVQTAQMRGHLGREAGRFFAVLPLEPLSEIAQRQEGGLRYWVLDAPDTLRVVQGTDHAGRIMWLRREGEGAALGGTMATPGYGSDSLYLVRSIRAQRLACPPSSAPAT